MRTVEDSGFHLGSFAVPHQNLNFGLLAFDSDSVRRFGKVFVRKYSTKVWIASSLPSDTWRYSVSWLVIHRYRFRIDHWVCRCNSWNSVNRINFIIFGGQFQKQKIYFNGQIHFYCWNLEIPQSHRHGWPNCQETIKHVSETHRIDNEEKIHPKNADAKRCIVNEKYCPISSHFNYSIHVRNAYLWGCVAVDTEKNELFLIRGNVSTNTKRKTCFFVDDKIRLFQFGCVSCDAIKNSKTDFAFTPRTWSEKRKLSTQIENCDLNRWDAVSSLSLSLQSRTESVIMMFIIRAQSLSHIIDESVVSVCVCVCVRPVSRPVQSVHWNRSMTFSKSHNDWCLYYVFRTYSIAVAQFLL